MTHDDIEDDGFEEILRDTPGARLAGCSVHCSKSGSGKNKQARRIVITVRTDRLPADVVAVLDQPRFNVAYNESAKALRIRAVEDGRFQFTRAPRGNHTYSLRFPYTDKIAWCEEHVAVEPDWIDARTIMLDLPSSFYEKRPQPSLAVESMRSAAPRPPIIAHQPEKSARVVELSRGSELSSTDPRRRVGVLGTLPRTLGTEYFQPREAHLIEALLREPMASHRDLMIATHDPSDGDDHRGPRALDILLGGMRARLADIGDVKIIRDNDTYRMSREGKQRVRQLAVEVDPDFK